MASGRVPTTTRTLFLSPEDGVGMPPLLQTATKGIDFMMELGHHLGHQSNPQKHEPDCFQKDHQVQKRSETHPFHEPKIEGDGTHSPTQDNQGKPRDPEKNHGFSGEEKKKPHRKEVDEADKNPEPP